MEADVEAGGSVVDVVGFHWWGGRSEFLGGFGEGGGLLGV